MALLRGGVFLDSGENFLGWLVSEVHGGWKLWEREVILR